MTLRTAVSRVPMAAKVLGEVEAAGVLRRAGVIRPFWPTQLLSALDGLLRYGTTVAAELNAAAALRPGTTAVIDDDGRLSFAEANAQSVQVAGGLQHYGISAGDRIALLAPNSRLPLITLAAAGRIGADVLLLNTGLSPGQVTQICAGENVSLIVVDPVLGAACSEVDASIPVIDDLEKLIQAGSAERVPARPGRTGHVVVMTSGTTGTPKGARRKDAASLVPPAALLSRIPYRAGGVTVVAAPLFHTWGFANLQLALVLGSTMVLSRRFDPAGVLRLVAECEADTLVAVPVMLSRMLEVPAQDRASTPTLRIACVSGSAFPGPLATRFQDTFGDVVYNLYGSTEVSWVSIATPEDLRANPSTAGRPPLGTRLALLDDAGQPVEPGAIGRIFVANDLLFDGYTGDTESPASVDGMMTTGDLGRLDDDGRLTVLGRSDGMVVSGGENVFPSEVEDVLAAEAGVREVAVIGVPDPEWGQRLAAFVVLRSPGSLDVDAVKAIVRGRLARFSVPRDVVFLTELPRNHTGKVLAGPLRDSLKPGSPS